MSEHRYAMHREREREGGRDRQTDRDRNKDRETDREKERIWREDPTLLLSKFGGSRCHLSLFASYHLQCPLLITTVSAESVSECSLWWGGG